MKRKAELWAISYNTLKDITEFKLYSNIILTHAIRLTFLQMFTLYVARMMSNSICKILSHFFFLHTRSEQRQVICKCIQEVVQQIIHLTTSTVLAYEKIKWYW